MQAGRPLRVAGRIVAGLVVAAAAVLGTWIAVNQVRARVVEVEPEQVAAPPGGRWVDAGDVEMFVQEWGVERGPTIVLTHGTGAWSGTWFGVPSFLAARGWHVVAVDLPPFGFTRARAEAAPLDYRRAAQARRLLRAIHALSNQPVVIMGHSFGAGPALEAAMQEPASVRKLVLVDPALGMGVHGEMPGCHPSQLGWPMDSRMARTALVRSSATVPVLTGTLLGRFVHRKEVITSDKLVPYRRPFVRKNFSAQLGDWAASFASEDCVGSRSTDATALAAWASQAKLALIWGAQDTITPPAQGVALGRLTGVTPTFISGVGHIPHIEDPDRFATALAAAISQEQ